MLEHHAFLTDAPKSVYDTLAEMAETNGFPVDRSEDGLKIRAPLGHVTMAFNTTGTAITFGAESPAQLQLLKDLYAQRFAKLGIDGALTWAAVEGQHPLNQMMGHVVSTERLSPNFMRLRLDGDFSAFGRPGAGLHFRLLFGPDGAGWPSLDKRGLTHWPDGAASWHRPPYTVRALGPEADWMDIDVVLHPGGRVTDWVQAVSSGTEIALHGPNGSAQPDARWLGLIGDETALPVIVRMIEGAPAGTKGKAIILVRDIADAQPVQSAADIDIAWDIMGRTDPVTRLHDLDPPDDGYHIFFAAERQQASRARQVYKELGFSSRHAKAASYWTRAAD